jgi:hypothetical protein
MDKSNVLDVIGRYVESSYNLKVNSNFSIPIRKKVWLKVDN